MTRYALSFSGGKDSTLALHRAVRQGLDVACLFTIYEGSSERVRFHGVRPSLIQAQADAVGIPLVLDHTHPDDYDVTLARVLDRLQAEGIGGIVFGNIHLADIRGWYEERTLARGLKHVEPLWGEDPLTLAREVVAAGYTPLVASIDLARLPREWVGRQLDDALLDEIVLRPGVDPAGERGEYHTFVTSGPLFRRPVSARTGERVEMEGHALVDLILGEDDAN
ncbi:MAG TPA: diphthine--ammonia ligase [Chloroflexota bacterium]|nr:diphthine--ammonia ligase [Chloroflexota bacterium]